MNPLDRPVWASLSGHHFALSEGGPLARRFVRDVNVFAAACDDSPAALAALAALVRPGEPVFVLQAPAIVLPPGLVASKTALAAQMVASRAVEAGAAQADIVALTDADAPEMFALARLTQPGPFFARTPAMGRFLGIRIDGRLVAMAGERLRWAGATELSGVCTHPDFRGRGLARRLSTAITAAIQARGDVALLHAWKENHAAIALYEELGFEWRTDMNIAVLEVQPETWITSRSSG